MERPSTLPVMPLWPPVVQNWAIGKSTFGDWKGAPDDTEQAVHRPAASRSQEQMDIGKLLQMKQQHSGYLKLQVRAEWPWLWSDWSAWLTDDSVRERLLVLMIFAHGIVGRIELDKVPSWQALIRLDDAQLALTGCTSIDHLSCN